MKSAGSFNRACVRLRRLGVLHLLRSVSSGEMLEKIRGGVEALLSRLRWWSLYLSSWLELVMVAKLASTAGGEWHEFVVRHTLVSRISFVSNVTEPAPAGLDQTPELSYLPSSVRVRRDVFSFQPTGYVLSRRTS